MIGVLRVDRDVHQVVDRLTVARQLRLAARRPRVDAVVAVEPPVGKRAARVAAGVRRVVAVGVLPVAAELERVVAARRARA